MMDDGKERKPYWFSLWRRETAWTRRELVKLCCGLEPQTGWEPGCDWNPPGHPDPDALDNANFLFDEADRLVRRAELAGDLRPLTIKLSATPEEIARGDGIFFDSRAATIWAAPRFREFPFKPEDFEEGSPANSPPGNPAAPTITPAKSAPIVHGQIAEGDGARAPLTTPLLPARPAQLSPQELLAAYKEKHSGISNAAIFRAAGIHKPDFSKWTRGLLAPQSKTAMKVRMFLERMEPPDERFIRPLKD